MLAATLRRWGRNLYTKISGSGVHVKPWHFQYVSTYYLHRALRMLLANYGGDILDVGCGNQPYRSWFGSVNSYTGLDVYSGERVDVVVTPYEPWPLPSASFDVVLCTQVLEHVADLQHTLTQIDMVLRPGGTVIASFPFIYNLHGEPDDYRRFSTHGARQLFPNYEYQILQPQGGIGSTLVILFLNWFDAQLSVSDRLRWIKAVILPLWLPFCLVANALALLIDRIDTTGKFYSNVLLVAKKPKE